MARYTLNELRQMDEAKVLELWNTPQIDFAQRHGDPLVSYNDYAELKREGREDPGTHHRTQADHHGVTEPEPAGQRWLLAHGSEATGSG